jgi:hypothetical protein
MKSSEAFDGDDVSIPEQIEGFLYRITLNLRPVPQQESQVGAADCTGIWLCMVPPIHRVFILCTASLTHGKYNHGCVLTVIGDALDNRKTWTTIGAVCEGIVEAPVVLVQYLLKTGVTGGNVWRNGGETSPILAASHDDKVLIPMGMAIIDGAIMNLCKDGRPLQDATVELLNGFFGTIYLDIHTGVGIADEALEIKREGAPVHQGSEPYALHYPLKSDNGTD